VRDEEEGVVYRVVARMDPLDGWAGTEFWQRRWKLDHKAVLSFVLSGWLDAAVECGSQVRRFRCRDEWGLKNSAEWQQQLGRVRRAAYNRARVKSSDVRAGEVARERVASGRRRTE
jgi:hypothetical protein